MLKRSYGRAAIMLYAAFFVVMTISCFIDSSSWIHGPNGYMIACGFQGAAVFIRDKYLRCTYCGKTFAPLQWSKSGTKHCKKCGKPFVYDK